jgi:hypothetical protein
MAEWRNSPTDFPNPVGLFFNIRVDGVVNMNENNEGAEETYEFVRDDGDHFVFNTNKGILVFFPNNDPHNVYKIADHQGFIINYQDDSLMTRNTDTSRQSEGEEALDNAGNVAHDVVGNLFDDDAMDFAGGKMRTRTRKMRKRRTRKMRKRRTRKMRTKTRRMRKKTTKKRKNSI